MFKTKENMKSNEICPEKSWNSNSFCFTFLKWYQDWEELYSEGSYRGTTEPDSWAQTQMNKTTDWLIKKIYFSQHVVAVQTRRFHEAAE